MATWENNFGTKTLDGFMKRLFESFPLKYNLKLFNKKIVIGLDKDRVAEMTLSTRGTHGQYERINVSIINKNTGVIASESFNFSDYLMSGFVSDSTHKYPKVIEHCGADWYMNGPSKEAIDNLMNKIAEYVSIYE